MTVDEKNVEVLRRLRSINPIGSPFRVLVDPSSDIPEQKSLTLIIMHPKYSAAIDRIDGATERFVNITSTKRGLSERIYRNTILYLLCSEAGLAKLNVKLADYIACNKVLSEYATALERDQKADIEARKRSYDHELEDSLVQAYSVVLKHSAKEGIHRYNIQEPSRDLSTLISINLPSKLKEEEWLLDSVGRKTLADNNLLPTAEMPIPVKLVYEAFLKYDDKPMISGPEAIEQSVRKYCELGLFNVAAGTSGEWDKVYQNTNTIPFFDPQSEEYWLVDPSVQTKSAELPIQPDNTSAPTMPNTDNRNGGDTSDTPIRPEETIKAFKSLTISGNVDMASWTQLFSSFIMPLKNNNLKLGINFKARSTEISPLNENSPVYRAVKESCAQLGLDLIVEEK